MRKGFSVVALIVTGHVSITLEHIFVNHQPLETDWPSTVQPVRADAHLCTQPVSEAVRKPRRSIVEYGRRINRLQELRG